MRFSSNIVEQQTAEALLERTTLLINEGLANSETLTLKHCYIKRDKNLRSIWLEEENQLNESSDRELTDDCNSME
eukprot:CAMPEP_0195541874 /NCGR_PEP_ID=MMETSP0794_2-20130614/51314_1 /TAXON_ID=515487 /ORGANISM="Stephanopyxis turris, Strain CCMP 815" /LENGTH=74 /DNA_ID=CAMNT_0040675989 /DNA_START=351 /DNA_END=575 /DNA_ORIENTATION=+